MAEVRDAEFVKKGAEMLDKDPTFLLSMSLLEPTQPMIVNDVHNDW